MRFMVMHKVDANMEAGGPPSQDIITQMGGLVQESLRSGVFLTGAGLHRSAKRARVTAAAGKTRVQRGPYSGENELLAEFAMVRDKSMDDAILMAQRFAEARGDAQIEVGPVVEPWDLGVMEKPAGNPPQRFLLLTMADGDFERGAPLSEARIKTLAEITESVNQAGQLLASGKLAPSSRGARSAPAPGQRTWVDGPFAESKELIAGFSILDVPTREDAIAWSQRYGAILGINQVDVRELVELRV